MKRIRKIICFAVAAAAVGGCVYNGGEMKNGAEDRGAYAEYTDAPKGYALQLPEENMQVDMTLGRYYTRYCGETSELVVSKEENVYDDVIYYTDHYFDRFMLSPDYREKNRIALNCHHFETAGDFNVKILSVTRTPYEGSEVLLNTYSYIYFYKDGEKNFYRLMLKTRSFEPETINRLIRSFREVPEKGTAENTISTALQLPQMTDETAAYYQRLCNSDQIAWGIFVPENEGEERIAGLEQRLDYRFDISMKYVHIPDEETTPEALEAVHRAGKVCELTLQTATLWNNNLDRSENPNFMVIDGVLDDVIRKHAGVVRDFGHPVIVRVNNEMNTDWTSYCGIQLMEDPEIYRRVFCRLVDLFREEGAYNTIWMFNPQYMDSPPANFNNYLGYFPGGDKVQLLGITEYNRGTYRSETDGGSWREFQEAYDGVESLYKEYFDQWPWMIGEFGSDSHGGDKVKWIENMFASIGKYKNIKGAVWLNWEAYDARKGAFGTVSRCYRLDETEETTEAFKQGLHRGK